MNRSKRILIGCLLAVWGASAVYILAPQWLSRQSNIAYAQTPPKLDLKATASGTTVDLKWTVITDATRYSIKRDTTDIASTINGTITSYKDENVSTGAHTYGVAALKSDGSIIVSESTNLTVSNTPTGGGTGGTSSPLSGTCEDNEAAARGVADAAKTKIENQTIFQVISQDGVKSVFKWTLSLVNLLVLFFLLAVAFANILRFQVDTYAIQKVFTPLILGVLLANFSWLISRFFIEVSTILYHALTDPYGGGAGLFKAISERAYGLDHLCSTARDSVASGFLGAFIGTALILVAGVLILTLYALLVARVWVITLLIVLSPLAFLCLGFPMTQQFFKKWWTMFFSWVFMAPASFLILVLAYQMADIGKGPNLTKFIIVTALLYYAIQVPFKMGGEWMTKWGGYVSQFKRKSADLADRSTKGIREGATKNIKAAAWNTGIGRRIQRGQERKAIKTENLDNRLKAAQLRGRDEFRNSPRGERLLRDRGQFSERAAVLEKARETENQEGLQRFLQSSSPEAQRLRQRQADITERGGITAKEVEQLRGTDRYKYLHETDRGQAINKRLGELRLEGKALSDELHHLESEADKAAKGSDPGQKLIARMRQLAKEHELEEHEIAIIEAKAQKQWDDSDAGKRLIRHIEEQSQLAKTAKEQLAGGELKTRNQWRDQDFAKEAARIKSVQRKFRLEELIERERAKGTNANQIRLSRLEAARAQVEAELRTNPGALSVEATFWEKERQVAEERMKKYDEQTSPEASKRFYYNDRDTALALRLQSRMEKRYAKADEELIEYEKSLSPEYKNIKNQLEAERKKLYEKLEKKMVADDPSVTQAQIDRATTKEFRKQAGDKRTTIGRLTTEQFEKSGAQGQKLLNVREAANRALINAEENAKAKKRISAEGTAEVRLELISSQDSVKEDLTEILARASEPTGDDAADRKRIMAVVNAKRAMWRNYIKQNEQIIERYGQLAFADMIRMNQAETAKRVGETLLGNKMTARDVQNLATDFSFRNFQAGAAKELVDGETKKAQVRVAIQMKTSQEYLDRIKSVSSSIDHLRDTLEQRKSGIDERIRKQADLFEADVRAKDKDKKKTDEQIAKERLDKEKELRKNEERNNKLAEREIKKEQQHLQNQQDELTEFVQDKYQQTGGDWNKLEEFLKPYFKKDENGRMGTDWTAVYDANDMPGGRKVNYDRVISVVGPDAKGRTSGYREQKSVTQRGQDRLGEGDDVYEPAVWQYIYTQQSQKQKQVMKQSTRYNTKQDPNYRPDPRDGHKPASEFASLIMDAQQYRTADALLARQMLSEPMPNDIAELLLVKMSRSTGYSNLTDSYRRIVDGLTDRMLEVNLDTPEGQREYQNIMDDVREKLVPVDQKDTTVWIAAFKEAIHWQDEGRLATG